MDNGLCLPPMTPEELRAAGIERPEPERGGTQAKRKGKARHSERFAVLNAFVDGRMAGLSGTQVKTWLCLFRDARGGVACTGQTWIARRVGLDERTVRRALQALERAGLIRRVYRGGPGKGASRYRIHGAK